jgi:preprotein translocase subunit SecD
MASSFPRWKYYLLFVSLVIGLLYSLPNIYGDDPAVQIIGLKGAAIDKSLIDKITNTLHEHNIAYKSAEIEEGALLVRFSNTNLQIQAMDDIKEVVDNSLYSTALNLVPVTPKWLDAIGAKPMKLGLDLRGGVRFLMEVDVESSIARHMAGDLIDIKKEFRTNKIAYKQITLKNDNTLLAVFRDASIGTEAAKIIFSKFPQYDLNQISNNDFLELSMRYKPNFLVDTRNTIMEQMVSTLRNRINELGVAEAVAQRQGMNRIVVELPGIQDIARAKEILGKTATIDFVMGYYARDVGNANRIPPDERLLYDRYRRPVIVKKRVILSGDAIASASSELSAKDNSPQVAIKLGGSGINLFSDTTMQNIGKPMAVIYREVKNGKTTETVISVATIQNALHRDFVINGLGIEEARDLSLLLRAGALPANIDIVEERIIGPSMGQENIHMGMISIIVGISLVLIVMTIYYSLFGIIANIALIFNLILLVAIMSLIGATLTLPGIAGIVLTLGMAVDAS